MDKDHVDSLAIELARLEDICFALSRVGSVDELVERLRGLQE